jgi:hypothetical protein
VSSRRGLVGSGKGGTRAELGSRQVLRRPSCESDCGEQDLRRAPGVARSPQSKPLKERRIEDISTIYPPAVETRWNPVSLSALRHRTDRIDRNPAVVLMPRRGGSADPSPSGSPAAPTPSTPATRPGLHARSALPCIIVDRPPQWIRRRGSTTRSGRLDPDDSIRSWLGALPRTSLTDGVTVTMAGFASLRGSARLRCDGLDA